MSCTPEVPSKHKRTLHLPAWICELLDYEGRVLGNKPGLVAAAGILMFAEADNAQKAECLRRLYDKELSEAYDRAAREKGGVEAVQEIAQRVVRKAADAAATDTPAAGPNLVEQ